MSIFVPCPPSNWIYPKWIIVLAAELKCSLRFPTSHCPTSLWALDVLSDAQLSKVFCVFAQRARLTAQLRVCFRGGQSFSAASLKARKTDADQPCQNPWCAAGGVKKPWFRSRDRPTTSTNSAPSSTRYYAVRPETRPDNNTWLVRTSSAEWIRWMGPRPRPPVLRVFFFFSFIL